jgi:hypothetical protein
LYTGTITTNASTTHLETRLIIKGNSGANNLVMTAWFDDIEIKPLTSPARRIVS